MKTYVERRAGAFYLVGSRVPLDCIVREYSNGESPETIRLHFPTLTLEQVHGAIAFYSTHRSEVETAMRERERVEDAFTATHPPPQDLKDRLESARRRPLSERS